MFKYASIKVNFSRFKTFYCIYDVLYFLKSPKNSKFNFLRLCLLILSKIVKF